MRVVLNNLTALRQKTGIGHYVTELVLGLRGQQPGRQFLTFPGPWIEAGARAANGLSMLLHQGALAFEIWFDRAAPMEAMRKALQ